MNRSKAREFYLTADEEQATEKWQQEHLTQEHPEAVNNPNCFAPIGGEWQYVFIPTTLGILAEVRCYCGERHIIRSFS